MSRAALTRTFIAALALVCAALVADAILAAPFFLSNDGPHHIFGAWARAHIDDAALGYSTFFVGNAPASANGVADLFALLAPSLGWRLAHQLVVVGIALLWLTGTTALAASFHRARTPLGLLVGAGALGWNLYLGFYEYALATALGFIVLALAITGARGSTAPTVAHRVIIGALLLVTAWIHFFAAALTGLALAAVWIARAERKRIPRELAWLAAVGAPAAILAVIAASSPAGLTDANEQAPWLVRLTALGACSVGGPLWRTLPVVAVAVTSLALVVVGWAGRRREERALAVFGAALALVPVLLPWSFLGWQDLGGRPMPVAAALLVALLPVERVSAVAQRGALLGAFAFFALATWWARSIDVEAADESADALRAVEAHLGHPAGYRWPFVLVSLDVEKRAEMLRWDPQRGLGSLFALTQGGFVAHSHVVSKQIHTTLLKPDVAATLAEPLVRSRFVTPIRAMNDAGARAHAVDVLLSHAVQVDGVIVIERPEDHARWRARGYTVDAEDGRVLLAHFTGCSLQVATTQKRDIVTALSPGGTDLLTRTDSIDGEATLSQLPCGALEVRGCSPSPVELRPSAVPRVSCSE